MKWTKEEAQMIKDNIDKVKFIKQLCPLLPGRSYKELCGKCLRMGIKKRRIRFKDEAFFETPNLNSSYWAGLICTDGTIRQPRHRITNAVITLGCQSDDDYHLRSFADDAKSNAIIIRSHKRVKMGVGRCKVDVEKDYYYSTVHFGSANKWMDDLKKNWNIPSGNKTFSIIRPNLANIELEKAYLKGLIDGDGTISLSRYTFKGVFREYMVISFLGTQDILLWIKDTVDKILGKKTKSNVCLERKGATIYRFAVNGYLAAKLFEELKRVKTPEMKRKWCKPEYFKVLESEKVFYPELFGIKVPIPPLSV